MAHDGFEFNQSFGSRRPSDLGDSLGRGAFVFILGFVYFGFFVDQFIVTAPGLASSGRRAVGAFRAPAQVPWALGRFPSSAFSSSRQSPGHC